MPLNATASESRAYATHLRNPLSPSLSPLPDAAGSRPVLGTNSASGPRLLALDLAVLCAILWVSLNLGLNPVASVGIGVGLERGQLAAAVGAAVLDLASRIGSAVLRKSRRFAKCPETYLGHVVDASLQGEVHWAELLTVGALLGPNGSLDVVAVDVLAVDDLSEVAD